MNVLEAHHLEITLGGVKALGDGNIEVAANQIVGVLGPNGAGKTTLLNCLNGQLHVESGEIRLDGVPFSRTMARNPRKAGISRSFQSPKLSSDLTIAENMVLGLSRSERRHGSHVRTVVNEMLETFGVAAYANVGPAECPYGVQKLAEVARAFVGWSKVVLLDEPGAGLDIPLKEVMVSAIVKAKERWNCGVVIVEHDLALIKELSEVVFALDLGRSIVQGTYAEVMKHERFIEAYIGGGVENG